MIELIGPRDADYRYEVGLQELITIDQVPAGAEALLGKNLLGTQLTIAGVYHCIIDLSAISRVFVDLMATSNSGTMPTTSGGSTYQDQVTQKTAWTGAGLMVSITRQTLSLVAANLNGEKVARVIITLPAASSCTFTQGEVTGKQ